MTAFDLKTIAGAGGSIVVNAGGYTAYDLKTVAAALRNEATLTIRGASKFTAYDCKTISAAAPGHVCFDFS